MANSAHFLRPRRGVAHVDFASSVLGPLRQGSPEVEAFGFFGTEKGGSICGVHHKNLVTWENLP